MEVNCDLDKSHSHDVWDQKEAWLGTEWEMRSGGSVCRQSVGSSAVINERNAMVPGVRM